MRREYGKNDSGYEKLSSDILSLTNQNKINNIMVSYKIWKKYAEIQLRKNKMDLNSI